MARLGDKPGLWQRIKRLALTDVRALARGLNAADLEQIEQLLIESDFGVPATLDLIEYLEAEVRRGKLRTDVDLKSALAQRLAALLAGPPEPGVLARPVSGPAVVLIMGVNGVGKTTTIAKLAYRLQRDGQKVILGAADTYRAGAIAQLETWAERIKVPCVSGAPGGDPAAVAFAAIEAGVSRGMDVVLIDTAGRLHTQDGLMAELGKVARVSGRKIAGAPHEAFLVLDGTVGQNAVQQGKLFAEVVRPTGLIVTKLDGSARGGAVVALRRELDVPIRFLGVGEGIGDLEAFDATRMAAVLIGEG
ncbi:MAG TPA: signal recognition particle-docking protein FtsY [Gemmatimonadales bacterium]|jgi:fused signal recognition particle receptor|nr:signal recognition particle-docking protein FtsY [Gemmatimonadales bacterium]